jgi:hypothetical protein
MVAIIGQTPAVGELKYKITPTNDNPHPGDGSRPHEQQFVTADPATPNSPLHDNQAQADLVTEAHKQKRITDADVPPIEDKSAHLEQDGPIQHDLDEPTRRRERTELEKTGS